MKKILFVSAVAVFALAVGLAYADESYPMAGQREAASYNGITVFDTGPALDCRSISGAGAGGLGTEEWGPSVINGVTVIDLRPADSGAKGSCASGLGMEEPGAKANNGITVFDF